MDLLLERMNRDEMDYRISDAEGFEVLGRDGYGIDVYDEQEDRFMRYRYLETLDVRSLVEFNSLRVDEDKFWRVFEDCVDYNSLMNVDRIVFVSNESELDELEASIDYEQVFDLDIAVGIYWWASNIVVINTRLLYESVVDVLGVFGSSELNREYGIGLMETLVHELRHVLTLNPIISEDMVSVDEVEEDAVELYCRRVTESILMNHLDMDFVII